MPGTYTLDSFEIDFFDTAPVTFRMDVTVAVTPQRAWAELTRQGTLDWCRAITSVEFTSPAPYGVGTTRRVQLAPAYTTVSEYYFDWVENPQEGLYHNAFRVVESNVPGLRRFGEYTEISPAAVGSRLVWAFALEPRYSPRGLAALLTPLSAPVFRSLETDTLRHFARLGTVAP